MLVEFQPFPINDHRVAALATRIHVESVVEDEAGRAPSSAWLAVSSFTASASMGRERFEVAPENADHLLKVEACRDALLEILRSDAHASRHVEITCLDHSLAGILRALARGERHPDEAVHHVLSEIAEVARTGDLVVWPRFAGAIDWRDDEKLNQEILLLLARSAEDARSHLPDLGPDWRTILVDDAIARIGDGPRRHPRAMISRMGLTIGGFRSLADARDAPIAFVDGHGGHENQVLRWLCGLRSEAGPTATENTTVRLERSGWSCRVSTGTGFRVTTSRDLLGTDEIPSKVGLPRTFTHLERDRTGTALEIARVAMEASVSSGSPLHLEGGIHRILDVLSPEIVDAQPILVHADASIVPGSRQPYGCVALRNDEGFHFAGVATLPQPDAGIAEAVASIDALERVHAIWNGRRYLLFTDHISWAQACSFGRLRPKRVGEDARPLLHRLLEFERRYGVVVDVTWIRGHTNDVDRNSVAHTLADRLAWNCRHAGETPPSVPSTRWVDDAISSLDREVAGRRKGSRPWTMRLRKAKLADAWNVGPATIDDLVARGLLPDHPVDGSIAWDDAARASQAIWESNAQGRPLRGEAR